MQSIIDGNTELFAHMNAEKEQQHVEVVYIKRVSGQGVLQCRVKKSNYKRIVNVSSSAHYGIDFEFDNMNGEKKYAGFETYKKSKLANVMFTYELAKRIESTGITANCLHPGFVSTNFGKNNNFFWRNAIRLAMMLTAINVKDGAKTSIHLACSDEVKNITGKFFANSQVKKGSSKAKNDEHNVKLWELSEEFVKPFL